MGTCYRFWSFIIPSSWIQLRFWVANSRKTVGSFLNSQETVGSFLNSQETVGSELNSQETVGSKLARVPRELSLGARQDVRQGCLQQDLLESRRLQTVKKLFSSLAFLCYFTFSEVPRQDLSSSDQNSLHIFILDFYLKNDFSLNRKLINHPCEVL